MTEKAISACDWKGKYKRVGGLFREIRIAINTEA
jgi:hypothetical protein